MGKLKAFKANAQAVNFRSPGGCWPHMDLMSFQITEIHTLTFWFKQYAYNRRGHPANWGRPWHGHRGDSGLWWNILHVGATHSERQPAIWLTSYGGNPRMTTRVSLENNEYGLACDPPSTWSNAYGKLGQNRGHWTMVA